MNNDHDRLASLFTPDAVLRMPNVPAELAGREQIRAMDERREALMEFFVQTTHPRTIQLDGDTASGRAYMQDLARVPRVRDGRSELTESEPQASLDRVRGVLRDGLAGSLGASPGWRWRGAEMADMSVGEDFTSSTGRFGGELLAHCYRMLGSADDIKEGGSSCAS